MKTLLLAIALTVSLGASLNANELGDELIVHEWGTFTSLQDEQGEAIGGVNTNDEPVPGFVHTISHAILTPDTEMPFRAFAKGTAACHPDITMRLETPVIYFHPPAGTELPQLDVEVRFKGGWITEYYPDGQSLYDAGQPQTQPQSFPGRLSGGTLGQLTWKNLRLNAPEHGPLNLPETTSRVWLAPREVKGIAPVTAENGESEKYLFYRGVGNAEASMKVIRQDENTLLLRPGAHDLPPSWLVHVLPDGALAFREVMPPQPITGMNYSHHWPVPAKFEPESFSSANFPKLRASMKTALVQDGLFADEAEAMLNTWDAAYFKAPGLRLFYLVPRSVTDELLPLKISGVKAAQITRVMVGRVEIVTAEQRELLAQLSAGPSPDMSPFFATAENATIFTQVVRGEKPLRELGLEVPELYNSYLRLGRFRNALILDEQRRRPSEHLAKFIKDNGFEGHAP